MWINISSTQKIPIDCKYCSILYLYIDETRFLHSETKETNKFFFYLGYEKLPVSPPFKTVYRICEVLSKSTDPYRV